MIPLPPSRALLLATLGVCALVVAGCAGLPRIDPSGERCFIWPQKQVPVVGPTTANAQAPPVYTAPVYPPSASNAQALAGLLPSPPQDKLTLSPDRVLAPVGSEVILKAGLCTSENYLLTDAKVEWILAREEVGEFVEVGGKGLLRNPLLPWNKSKKIDNQYATGYTAKVPLQITRGTADPSDDVQVQPGEAWASITSPVEGTSRITAVAPEVVTWANRRATATIYWVDVQWTFPPPSVSGGDSQILTTVVRRQTDGTPLEGWLVRYEVADGGGALRGEESGQVVEVRTDAQGRASIDVTPTGSSGSTTVINTQIVRPERFAGSNAPRLVIANGASTIQWSGGTPYVPVPDDLGSPLPSEPPLVVPSQSDPAPPITRRGPQLELEIFTTDTQVEVGQSARFEVVIRNTGDSPATGIVLNDQYDAGFSHLRDRERTLEISKPVADIPAGDTHSEFLTFDAIGPGRLCQNITATYDGGGRAQQRKCIEATQPLVQPQGELEVRKIGPRLKNVGEFALFKLSIKNIGAAPLTNIVVEDEYDRALLPQPTQPGAQISNGSLRWSIPRLDAGETWSREVNCQCVAPARNARSTVSVTADTGTVASAISKAEQTSTEIRPVQNVVPDPGSAPGGVVTPDVTPPASPNPTGPNTVGALRMELNPFSNPVRAGARETFQIVISNPGTTSDKQVELRLLLPPEFTPDVAAIRNEANVRAEFNQGVLTFAPIAEMRPNERLEFVIPCNVNQQGLRTVTAELRSQNMPQGLQQTKQVEILAR